jgi:glycosyltransferase involved in cell wall biosynthesis
LLRENPVTIVIPTKDRADLLGACLDSIARTTPRESVKVVVVDDQSTNPEAVTLLERLATRADLRVEVVPAPASPGGFNYSRLVNLGTARVDTPLVLHLNNDVEALTPGWLEDMVGWLTLPGTGIVGAKLLYPDGTLNHAGISLGREDGLPHVLFEREPADDLGTLFLPHTARHVVAVTGACLLTRTALYRQLLGFDELALAVAYNDVDYCLRAADAGHRTIFTPQAVLRHQGSATRGRSYAESEHVAYLARHGTHRDPYHSEALDFPPRNLPLNPYHLRYAQTSRPFRIMVLTHNLNFEGAPIFIFELARYLAEQPGLSVSIASPQDGPLRTRFEQLGLKVEIWNHAGFLGAKSTADFGEALENLAAAHPCAEADVIVCNTMLTFWGVHLASRLGKPSALYVHESNAVKRFFAPLLPSRLHETVEEAFRLATRVIFTAEATRVIHEPLNANDNFRALNSWVDFARIETFKATHDRNTLRRKHGLDSDAVIIVNIGSVCERKGQHIYIRGIDLLKKELPTLHPGQKIQWVMVGARDGLYMETLQEDIQLMSLQEVKIFPETPDIYDFYHLADLLVCTSFEESFPRVLLEAMVFGTRIVSTDVNGIPEMVTNTDEAHLVPAGDPFKLAAALKKALADHFAGDQKMLSMAYARAARNYHHARALPPHVQMIREAWLG